MLLWDIIRDWFVQYVFGGYTSFNQSFKVTIGRFLTDAFEVKSNLKSDSLFIPIVGATSVNSPYTNVSYVSLGDWLSTTATLIVMIAICVGLFFLIRYFFRMFAGLISGR